MLIPKPKPKLTRNVFPAPQRMFDPQDKAYKPFLSDFEQVAGGRYLEMGQDGPKDITGEFAEAGFIGVDPTGKPTMKVSEGLLDGEFKTTGRKIKVNLAKKKTGWNWTKVPEGYNPNPDGSFPIVSVHDGKKHYFTLNADFPEGMDLARYPNEKSEPRLKPTKKGNVHFGNVVGEIEMRGKKHPVYDNVSIYNVVPSGGLLGDMADQEQEKPARGLLGM